jgi:hypothetical protein
MLAAILMEILRIVISVNEDKNILVIINRMVARVGCKIILKILVLKYFCDRNQTTIELDPTIRAATEVP